MMDSPNQAKDEEAVKTEDIELEMSSSNSAVSVTPGYPDCASTNSPPRSARSHRSSRTADNIYDKIFHSPPSDYLALKLYGRIIPGNPHKQKLQPGDSKWMIHPYSYFK